MGGAHCLEAIDHAMRQPNQMAGIIIAYLHYARDGAPLARWLSTMAVSGLVLYACRHGRSRLRRCAAAGCGRWLVDTSRNQSRRYCEHACASRVTVAAYRAGQQAHR